MDQIGGLYDAVRYAAKEVGLGDYDVRVIPEPPNIFDLLMQGSGDQNYAHMALGRQSLVQAPLVEAMLPALRRADPLRAEALIRALRQLDLLQAESVILATRAAVRDSLGSAFHAASAPRGGRGIRGV